MLGFFVWVRVRVITAVPELLPSPGASPPRRGSRAAKTVPRPAQPVSPVVKFMRAKSPMSTSAILCRPSKIGHLLEHATGQSASFRISAAKASRHRRPSNLLTTTSMHQRVRPYLRGNMSIKAQNRAKKKPGANAGPGNTMKCRDYFAVACTLAKISSTGLNVSLARFVNSSPNFVLWATKDS